MFQLRMLAIGFMLMTLSKSIFAFEVEATSVNEDRMERVGELLRKHFGADSKQIYWNAKTRQDIIQFDNGILCNYKETPEFLIRINEPVAKGWCRKAGQPQKTYSVYAFLHSEKLEIRWPGGTLK
ncbi:MAG: hypothetical protein KBD63_06050 [Bacteriovoracaceae bacterium]|nr:hypothetical protein [Bacteriovoracaceae bacterium]